MSILKDAADILEYYYKENIPAQETIGMHIYIDAVREAHNAIKDLLENGPEIGESRAERLRKLVYDK